MQNYVEKRDGGYYIAGTRISLDSIVHAFHSRMANRPTRFSAPFQWPALSSGFTAITFYLENKEKVEEYLEDQERRWEALRRERPKSGDPLTNRLREAKEHASLRRS